MAFRGTYVFENPDESERQLRVKFKFPAEHAIYDDFTLTIDGAPARRGGDLAKEVEMAATVGGRGRVTLEVGYRSRGIDDWRYGFGAAGVTDVRDFQLVMRTNFRAIDFPPGSVSPGERVEEGGGWRLTWGFTNLVTGQVLGMDLPNRVNPGPLAARITFFAPVSLLFFLMVMVILDVLSGSSLHPMNYFFISAAFFAFHLLLAYLVDHMSLQISFAAAAAASVGLVTSYLRVVAGMRQRAVAGGGGAGDLPGGVQQRVLLRGADRPGRHHRRGADAVRADADDRRRQLGPGFRQADRSNIKHETCAVRGARCGCEGARVRGCAAPGSVVPCGLFERGEDGFEALAIAWRRMGQRSGFETGQRVVHPARHGAPGRGQADHERAPVGLAGVAQDQVAIGQPIEHAGQRRAAMGEGAVQLAHRAAAMRRQVIQDVRLGLRHAQLRQPAHVEADPVRGAVQVRNEPKRSRAAGRHDARV